MSPYFAGTDMRRPIDHQTRFIAFLRGGLASYSDEQLRKVRSHAAIDREAFEEMVDLLTETLEGFRRLRRGCGYSQRRFGARGAPGGHPQATPMPP